MRPFNAVLLLSSIGALFTPNVLGLPIRIVVVEKVSPNDVDAFLRSVRIGHAAGANSVRVSDKLDIEAAGFPPNAPDTHATPIEILPFFPRPLPDSSVEEVPGSLPAVNEAKATDEVKILPFQPSQDIIEKHAMAIKEMCERERRTWNARFGRMSDWVRELFGLPPVSQNLDCNSAVFDLPIPIVRSSPAVLPTFARPIPSPVPMPEPIQVGRPCHHPGRTSVADTLEAPLVTRPRFRRPSMWAHRRPRTFTGRVQRALYSLSPWEGRALAFVLGCGLGVLLRMMFVLVVLGVRAWRGRNNTHLNHLTEGEDEYPTEPFAEGVILFDAASIKSASQEDLPVYNEKQ